MDDLSSADYQRAATIAQRACHRWALSRQDWEEVIQDAALAAWRTPEHPTTAAWWGARDSAAKILGTRRAVRPRKPSQLNDAGDPAWYLNFALDDTEAEALACIAVDEMLAGLPPVERMLVEETVLADRTPQELSRALGMWDSTVRRGKARSLAQLRSMLEETP